ncbi:MAG TPA: hypothetical protein PLC42_01040 [Parachlamydiaceae bacterium]|nr:hypothetical protein [Parachlamydiaceae bacterium]
MEVTLHDIKQIYIDLINDKMSREDASNWAFLMMHQEDSGNLSYSPLEYKDRIWLIIKFLAKFDLQVEPGEYLYGKEDLQEIFKILN